MSLWTNKEFQRVAVSTKMSIRTLDACHDVLVGGMTNADSCRLHNVLPSQISRALRILRERQDELVKAVNELTASKENLKEYAIKEAKKLVHGDWEVKDPERGCVYEGPGIMKTPGYMVQRVGRTLVVHDLGKLKEVPNMSARMVIKYPNGYGRASVSEGGHDSTSKMRRFDDIVKSGPER